MLQKRGDGDCDLGLMSRSIGKCLDCGYILKLELTEFPDRLDTRYGMKCKE